MPLVQETWSDGTLWSDGTGWVNERAMDYTDLLALIATTIESIDARVDEIEEELANLKADREALDRARTELES